MQVPADADLLNGESVLIIHVLKCPSRTLEGLVESFVQKKVTCTSGTEASAVLKQEFRGSFGIDQVYGTAISLTSVFRHVLNRQADNVFRVEFPKLTLSPLAPPLLAVQEEIKLYPSESNYAVDLSFLFHLSITTSKEEPRIKAPRYVGGYRPVPLGNKALSVFGNKVPPIYLQYQGLENGPVLSSSSRTSFECFLCNSSMFSFDRLLVHLITFHVHFGFAFQVSSISSHVIVCRPTWRAIHRSTSGWRMTLTIQRFIIQA